MASNGINLLLGPSLDAVTETTEPLDVCAHFSDQLGHVALQASAFTEGLHSASIAVCAMSLLESSMHEYYRLSSPEQEDTAVDLEETPEDMIINHMMPSRRPDGIFSSFSLTSFADPFRASRAQKTIIQRVFRHRCGFQGPIISDCAKVTFGHIHCPVHAPLLALLSGADMVVLPSDPALQHACIEALHAAVDRRFLPPDTIATAANRVTALKRRRLSWESQTMLQDPQGQLDATAEVIYRSAITTLQPDVSPLSDLPVSAVLLVLTPSVPSVTALNGRTTYDPFEALGHAIANFHPRTRHVPYIISTGLTATHVAFLQRVNAIVLVLCNASSAFSESQAEFVDAVQATLQEQEPAVVGGSNGVGERVKKVVLAVGDPRDLRPTSLNGWWKACCYEYTKAALESSAEVLMGRRHATGVAPIRI